MNIAGCDCLFGLFGIDKMCVVGCVIYDLMCLCLLFFCGFGDRLY